MNQGSKQSTNVPTLTYSNTSSSMFMLDLLQTILQPAGIWRETATDWMQIFQNSMATSLLT